MNIIHLYQLHIAIKLSKSIKGAKILDFGCGIGNVVKKGIKFGLNIYGADIFYEGSSNVKKKIKKDGLLGNVIREIKNEKLNFENNYFDFVMSNMVFEHLKDIHTAMREIHRVLKKNRHFLCLFPLMGVLIENHIGIPFAHWFKKKSRFRYHYVYTLRCLGFGRFKGNLSKRQWTLNQLNWIDKFTFYRSKDEILHLFSKYFEIRFIEHDLINFIMNSKKILKNFTFMLKFSFISKIISIIIQKLGLVSILGRKK